MKNKVKYLRLIGKGFSSRTLNTLSESEINTLYKKLFKEQVTQVSSTDAKTIANLKSQKKPFQLYEKGEFDENVTDDDAFTKDALSVYTGQKPTHDADDMAPDGMDDDSDDDRKMMDEAKRKSKEKNPWAICTSQLGGQFKTTKRHLWSAKQKNKYERCVRDVKKSLKEGKNPVSLFLENQIMRIVDKHIPPRITKSDLIKYLNEDTETAPSKPKTKPKTEPKDKPKPRNPHRNPNPGEESVPKAKRNREVDEDTTTAPTKPITKPTTRPKPKSPGGNPNPGEESVPKAGVSAEKAKNIVIQAIGKILEK